MEIKNLEIDGESMIDCDNYAAAEDLFKRALQLKEQTFGLNSLELAKDNYDLGLLCFAQDKFVEAEIYLYKALSLEVAHLGIDHPYTRESLAMLADLAKTDNKQILESYASLQNHKSNLVSQL